jgi:hypothetical protein
MNLAQMEKGVITMLSGSCPEISISTFMENQNYNKLTTLDPDLQYIMCYIFRLFDVFWKNIMRQKQFIFIGARSGSRGGRFENFDSERGNNRPDKQHKLGFGAG